MITEDPTRRGAVGPANIYIYIYVYMWEFLIIWCGLFEVFLPLWLAHDGPGALIRARLTRAPGGPLGPGP